MLKNELNQKIKNISIEELKIKLAYQSAKKLEKSINIFMETKTIYDWLNSGFYDLVYDAKELFLKLCEVFGIWDLIVQNELNYCENLKNEIYRFKGSYIFVNTNFKRKNESIFALALCEKKRRISLFKNERFLFKTKEEILELVSNIVIEHYKINDGKCSIWGNIINYQLNLFDTVYIYSLDGKIENVKEKES